MHTSVLGFWALLLGACLQVSTQDECAKLKTVPIGIKPGEKVSMFVVSQTIPGQSCKIVSRAYSDGSDKDLEVNQVYLQDGKPMEDKFHLVFEKSGYYKAKKNGKEPWSIAYLMYTKETAVAALCTGGKTYLQVSSNQPLPDTKRACGVKKMLEDNGFSMDDFVIVPNCGCKGCSDCPEKCPEPPEGGYVADC